MADLREFRAEVRSWLEANCPQSMRTTMPEGEMVWGGRRARFISADAKAWLERMAERGWTVPMWPTKYGGGGLSHHENQILQEELRRINARLALQSFGIGMLGPAMLEFANEEQKLEHLPKIVRGEIRWCQGYSEPGSGSDLASLHTRAEDKGDYYLVNGSKIWTSYADQADWIFCLVRTDRTAPKHQGISFLLFDMESAGISTSPIKLISGVSPFCQTFFDNVRVPKANLVGELNNGWTIAKRLLQHERHMISGIGGRGGAGQKLEDLAAAYVGRDTGRIADPVLRNRIARHCMNDQAFHLTQMRDAEVADAGTSNGNLASMFKYYGTEQNKRKFELLLDSMGIRGIGWDREIFKETEITVTQQWLRSKANSIEGGTSEVQLNVIAKRVLGLPD